jgi:hypothetical protein
MVGIVNGLLVAVTPTPRPPLRQLEAAKRASEEAVWHERWHYWRLSIGHQEPPGVAPGSLLEAFPDRFACRDVVPPERMPPRANAAVTRCVLFGQLL